jgi:2TM domain
MSSPTPSTQTTDDQDLHYQRAYRSARRQVKLLRSWYLHALIFTVIVGFFWLRYVFGGAFADWSGHLHTPRMPLGITFGWGLGLLIHGLVVWGRFSFFGPAWKETQMKRLLEAQGVTYRENNPYGPYR